MKHNLKPGDQAIYIENGTYWEYPVTILEITSYHILLKRGWLPSQKVIKALPEQVLPYDPMLVQQGPFWTGDTVFLHRPSERGDEERMGTVRNVFPEHQTCLVTFRDGGTDNEHMRRYDFHDLCLVTPQRRPPDEDCLRAIEHAIPALLCEEARSRLWWAQHAQQDSWTIERFPELSRAYAVFEEHLQARRVAESVRRQDQWKQAYAGLSHTEKIARWQEDYLEWLDWHAAYQRFRREEVYPALLTPEECAMIEAYGEEPEATEEEKLLAAIHGFKIGNEATPLLHHVGRLESEGLMLAERCENSMKSRQHGYAYDRIPFRPVVASLSPQTTPAPLGARFPDQQPVSAIRTEPFSTPHSLLQAKTALEHWTKRSLEVLASLSQDGKEDSVALLLQCYAATSALDDVETRFHRTNLVEIALFTARHHKAMAAIAQKQAEACGCASYNVVGLMHRGMPQAFFWQENPWAMRMDEGVDMALNRLWAPLEPMAPHFVQVLRTYVLGLVLLKERESGTLALGYLHLVPYGDDELRKYQVERQLPSSLDSDRLIDWMGLASLSMLIGYAPHDPHDDRCPRAPEFRLPVALRELYSLHAGIEAGNTLSAPQRLSDFTWVTKTEDLLTRFNERTSGHMPDRYIAFAHDRGGDEFVFDRDRLDTRGDPLVAYWDHETWNVGGHQPFWDWFEEHASQYFLFFEER
ncbi:MAG: SMI1/KNR4 family protein [Ktedonobacteraceae bacterium]|nr:SMI1/KNR4 family protein [Ktedonobacteraceae bacterium]